MSRYSHVSTSTLRAVVRSLSGPLLPLFQSQVTEIQKELLKRELPDLAEEIGGVLVPAPVGVQ